MFVRTPLLSLILSNVNRLYNKTQELCARLENDKDIINSQVICFTEKWLADYHTDDSFKPIGFSFFRNDRYRNITQKDDGGGVCLFINDKWCTHVKFLSKVCTKNLECLSLKCQPFYLPREFSLITITGIYIHPAADKSEALHDLTNIDSKMATPILFLSY